MEFTGGESRTETPESILKDSREQGRGPQTTAPTATIACAGVIQGFRLSPGPKLPGPGLDGHCNPRSDNSFLVSGITATSADGILFPTDIVSPEPASAALLVTGAALFMLLRKRLGFTFRRGDRRPTA